MLAWCSSRIGGGLFRNSPERPEHKPGLHRAADSACCSAQPPTCQAWRRSKTGLAANALQPLYSDTLVPLPKFNNARMMHKKSMRKWQRFHRIPALHVWPPPASARSCSLPLWSAPAPPRPPPRRGGWAAAAACCWPSVENPERSSQARGWSGVWFFLFFACVGSEPCLRCDKGFPLAGGTSSFLGCRLLVGRRYASSCMLKQGQAPGSSGSPGSAWSARSRSRWSWGWTPRPLARRSSTPQGWLCVA